MQGETTNELATALINDKDLEIQQLQEKVESKTAENDQLMVLLQAQKAENVSLEQYSVSICELYQWQYIRASRVTFVYSISIGWRSVSCVNIASVQTISILVRAQSGKFLSLFHCQLFFCSFPIVSLSKGLSPCSKCSDQHVRYWTSNLLFDYLIKHYKYCQNVDNQFI